MSQGLFGGKGALAVELGNRPPVDRVRAGTGLKQLEGVAAEGLVAVDADEVAVDVAGLIGGEKDRGVRCPRLRSIA